MDFLGTRLICASLKAREIGFDKLSTTEFLKNSNLPFPITNVISSLTDCTFPVILKSRKGSGSKSIFILNDSDDFNYYQKKYPDFITQELLAESSDEFTCGLFRSKKVR